MRAHRRALTLSFLLAAGSAWPKQAAPTAPPRPVRTYSLASRSLGATRRIWVYTPPEYAAGGPENDLLLVFDGREFLEDIQLARILDTLIDEKRLPPTLAVLMDNASGAARLADLGNHERFADFVASELVPWARRTFKVSADPHRCTVIGSSAGGLAAAFVALRHPELFGNVLSQSGAFWRGAEGSDGPPFDWLAARYAAAPKRDIRFFLDVGSAENIGAIDGTAPSILEANRKLRDTLRSMGYEVSYTEVQGGRHSTESWRDRLPIGLVWIASGRRP